MTGSTRSSGGLDDRRKRLLFRCWHRGTREMDLILGRFADAEIANLSDDEIAQFEFLMNVPDPDAVTPMISAIINGHYDVAAYLVEKGADPNLEDETGRPASARSTSLAMCP